MTNATLQAGSKVDFRKAFDAIPGSYLILKPNPPQFTILAISDELLHLTNRKREEVIGLSLFEVYPENPNDDISVSHSNLMASLRRVIQLRKQDFMPVTRYDVANAEGEFEERYWLTNSKPVHSDAGSLLYIIHATQEVTEQVLSSKKT